MVTINLIVMNSIFVTKICSMKLGKKPVQILHNFLVQILTLISLVKVLGTVKISITFLLKKWKCMTITEMVKSTLLMTLTNLT
jgi:hypothetical protein